MEHHVHQNSLLLIPKILPEINRIHFPKYRVTATYSRVLPFEGLAMNDVKVGNMEIECTLQIATCVNHLLSMDTRHVSIL